MRRPTALPKVMKTGIRRRCPPPAPPPLPPREQPMTGNPKGFKNQIPHQLTLTYVRVKLGNVFHITFRVRQLQSLYNAEQDEKINIEDEQV